MTDKNSLKTFEILDKGLKGMKRDVESPTKTFDVKGAITRETEAQFKTATLRDRPLVLRLSSVLSRRGGRTVTLTETVVKTTRK